MTDKGSKKSKAKRKGTANKRGAAKAKSAPKEKGAAKSKSAPKKRGAAKAKSAPKEKGAAKSKSAPKKRGADNGNSGPVDEIEAKREMGSAPESSARTAERAEGSIDPAGVAPGVLLTPPKRPEMWWTETVEPSPESYGPPIDRPAPPVWEAGLLGEARQLQQQVWSELTQHGLVAGGVGAVKKLAGALSPKRFWKLWGELALTYRSPRVDEFGFDPRFFHLVEPMLDFLYSRYFRVETLGISNIPTHGKALLVSNHSGTLPLDGAMILHAVRRDHRSHRQVRTLVEDFVFHFPFVGTIINRIGGIRACQENAERLLDAGQLTAVFPEGVQGIGKPFSQRYKLQRFGRGGFVKLALRTRSPIIPVAVVGAEEIYPMIARLNWLSRSLEIPYVPITPLFPLLGPLGLIPLPTKWFIRFGEPIRFHELYGPEAASDRLLINKLAEQVRTTIQVMVDATLKERRSVFSG